MSRSFRGLKISHVACRCSSRVAGCDFTRPNQAPQTPRIFTAFRGFTGKAGYPTSAPGMKGVPFEVETPEQAKKDVAFLADKKVDIVKIWVDDHFGRERK